VVPRHHDHEAEPGADRKGDGDGAPMGAPQERLRDAPTCASDMHFAGGRPTECVPILFTAGGAGFMDSRTTPETNRAFFYSLYLNT